MIDYSLQEFNDGDAVIVIGRTYKGSHATILRFTGRKYVILLQTQRKEVCVSPASLARPVVTNSEFHFLPHGVSEAIDVVVIALDNSVLNPVARARAADHVAREIRRRLQTLNE
jgi:hypothetical protein